MIDYRQVCAYVLRTVWTRVCLLTSPQNRVEANKIGRLAIVCSCACLSEYACLHAYVHARMHACACTCQLARTHVCMSADLHVW